MGVTSFFPCQDGFHQAQSNLTFLSILKEPYQELASMRPRDISSKLPKLISLIRIIWVNSPHYNTRERLTSLFRKVCVRRGGVEGFGGGTAGTQGRSAEAAPPGPPPPAAQAGSVQFQEVRGGPGGLRQRPRPSACFFNSRVLRGGLGGTACFRGGGWGGGAKRQAGQTPRLSCAGGRPSSPLQSRRWRWVRGRYGKGRRLLRSGTHTSSGGD